ncbi:MAG TPA: cupin domain-containing protein [Pseudonocardia sp.]|uniref:cupin domain-containing protein n=1 Tax=Pseudonocardia sp. TaxID=60912 RepID=UPI002C14237A|nr:cupin domain-containing protein [Pseudonocardia sp.]HTF52696.1 cupin domain-containing protein [Pseudonocardia sp.]
MTQRNKSLMTEGPAPFTLGPSGGRRFALPTRGSGTVKLGAAGSDGTVSAFELVMESGEGPGLHVHSREHELWYVLEGEFRFLLGDALVHQPTGGLAFGPRGIPHTFQNIGAGTGRLLVITSPSGLEEFFLEYDRRASGPYDAEALQAAARVGELNFVGPPLKIATPRAIRPGRCRR